MCFGFFNEDIATTQQDEHGFSTGKTQSQLGQLLTPVSVGHPNIFDALIY